MGDSPKRKSLGSQVRLPGELGFPPELEYVFFWEGGYGLRTVVGCWGPGYVAAPRVTGRSLCSSLLIPVGLCDLGLVTGSTRSRAKDKESSWGFGHLGKV